MPDRPLKIGITCYPSVGGSGILASELGEELAKRGHEIHFISYEPPFRMPAGPRVFFHPVQVNSYDLFKYPDYTLPLSVKMAEVARVHSLDVLHVHYAVPHATAAILARAMLHQEHRLKIITTLHGTDTTLLGRDPGYGPAIAHALENSDAITTVSEFMRAETVRLLGVKRSIEVIHNFFEPHPPRRSRAAVRRELGLADNEAMILPEVPKSIVIIGAGAIGVEFAYLFNAFGAKVTLVEMMPNILPIEDREIDGRGAGRGGRAGDAAAHHPSVLHPGRQRRRHRL